MDLTRLVLISHLHTNPETLMPDELSSFLTALKMRYGLVYFVEEMLRTRGNSISGKVVAISGSGNVAQFAAEKVMTMGGKVVTFSDSDGFVHDPQGVDAERLAFV